MGFLLAEDGFKVEQMGNGGVSCTCEENFSQPTEYSPRKILVSRQIIDVTGCGWPQMRKLSIADKYGMGRMGERNPREDDADSTPKSETRC